MEFSCLLFIHGNHCYTVRHILDSRALLRMTGVERRALGNPGTYTAPDWFTAETMNTLLIGQFKTRGNLNLRRELNEPHVPSFCPIMWHFDHSNGCRVLFRVNRGNFVLLRSIKGQSSSLFSEIYKRTTKGSYDPKEKFRCAVNDTYGPS